MPKIIGKMDIKESPRGSSNGAVADSYLARTGSQLLASTLGFLGQGIAQFAGPGLSGLISRESSALQDIPEYLFGKPNSTGEQISQRVAKSLPAALATGGGSIAKPIAETVGSSVGAQAGSNFGPAGEIIGGIAGGSLIPKAANLHRKQNRPSTVLGEKLIPSLQNKQNIAYEKAGKLAQGVVEDAPEIAHLVKSIPESYSHGVPESVQKKINETIGSLDNGLKGGKFSLESAKEIKKVVNRLSKWDSGSNTLEKDYYKKIAHGLNKFIQRTGEKHPEHGAAFSEGEKLTSTIKQLHKEAKAIDGTVSDLPAFLKKELSNWTIPGLAGYFLGPKAGIGARFIKSYAHEAKKVNRILQLNPDLHKDFYDIIKNSVKVSKPVLIQQLLNVNERLKDASEEKKQPKQSKRIRIVGRIAA